MVYVTRVQKKVKLPIIRIFKLNKMLDTHIIPFQSTHNLPFLSAPWDSVFNLGDHWKKFKIGTCEGAWDSTDSTYDILAIVNEKPGNGHFTDVLEWFEMSCKRDGRVLRFLEVWNRDLARHLVRERGFEREDGDNYVKRFL